mmetsp:Transcript_13039/g.30852  ORF Transcript_13039/g.30852 Transcript_13039/m.30852 type:complete len:214 (-) Transcript_13039:214-855(-)
MMVMTMTSLANPSLANQARLYVVIHFSLTLRQNLAFTKKNPTLAAARQSTSQTRSATNTPAHSPAPTSPRDMSEDSIIPPSPTPSRSTRAPCAPSTSAGTLEQSTTVSTSMTRAAMDPTETRCYRSGRRATLLKATIMMMMMRMSAAGSGATTTMKLTRSSPKNSTGSTARTWRLARPTRSTGPTLLAETAVLSTSTRPPSLTESSATPKGLT